MDWHERAILEGKRAPCPICKATGRIRSPLSIVWPDSRYVPKTVQCYHCHGIGDEAAAKRRNIGGQRPLR